MGSLLAFSPYIVPLVVLFVPTIALFKGVKVYESFVEGAKEGFATAVRILPYLLTMLMAITVFRNSGALDALLTLLRPVTTLFRIPEPLVPLALVRPLSGSGALGLLSDILFVHGPDSFVGRSASVLMGSTETTFYVLTVYCGAVGVKNARHSLLTGLLADLSGFLAAIYLSYGMFG